MSDISDRVADVLSKLDPSLRKMTGVGADVRIEMQKTPSMTLNHALNGGLAYGRQILIYGSKSAGKSSFCLQMIGEAQKQGKTAAWIDTEQSFDPDWATRLGVDNSALIHTDVKSINHVVDVASGLMKAGVDIVVIDSISAALPAVYFEKGTDDLKHLENTKQIGAEARDWTNAVKMLGYSNSNTLLVLISQQRANLGQMYVNFIPTGGKAVQFHSSTVLRLTGSSSEAKQIKRKIPIGDKMIEQQVGRPIDWYIEFNKTGPMHISGQYDFYYRGNNVGVDKAADLYELAMSLGIASRAGSWYQWGDHKVQGRDALVEIIRENFDECLEQVNERIRD